MCLGEYDAFVSQAVDVGRYSLFITHTFEGVTSLCVGGDQEDVGFGRHGKSYR